MKIHQLCAAASLVVLGLGHAAGAAAQSIDSPYRFLDHSQFAGIYGGYLFTADGAIGHGPLSAPAVGARWGIRVAGPLSVTTELSYVPTTRTVRDTVFSEADSTFASLGETDMKLLIGMLNMRLSLMGARTWYDLHPYFLAGIGVGVDIASASEAEVDLAANTRFDFGTSFAGQLGAGVEWFPTSRVSVRADVRDILWKLTVPEAFRLTTSGTERQITGSSWEQNFLLSAGLSIHF